MSNFDFPRPETQDWAKLAAQDSEPWPEPLGGEHQIYPYHGFKGDERMWKLYELAIQQNYDLMKDVDWAAIDPSDLTYEQRLGLAYWFGLDGIYEQAGPVIFARALIGAYESREYDSIRRLMMTVTRDESYHDLMLKEFVARLVPGFPYDFEPKTELEWAAVRNMAWVQANVNRAWKAYLQSFSKYRFQLILSGFASGEAVATMLYAKIGKDTSQPVLKQLMGYITKDEARHFSLAAFFMDRYLPHMREEERQSLLKNPVASYAYFSVWLSQKAHPMFWKHLPESFNYWHETLEDYGISAGWGMPTREERRDFWRQGMLRVKTITDSHGLEFPAIPELDIDGQEMSVSPDDVIVAAM